MADWHLESLTGTWQRRWWDAGAHLAERGPSGRPTYFLHFAYPGVSGYLHVGHMRGFTYTDVFARYKRLTGHDVLFPAGFHASGIPAVAFAKEVERGEKTEYLRANGYEGDLEEMTDPVKVVEHFAHVYTHEYWKRFGFLIDDRRNCTTIDPGYQRFIQWQFRRLHDLGHLVQKPHYAPYCPVAGPVAVDKSETDIRTGGAAEVLEFLALRFTIPAGELVDTDDILDQIVLPCATMRPETLYGVTNLWVDPEHEYELVRVWQDGAVGPDDPSEVWVVSKQGRVKCKWQFERAEALELTVRGDQLVGRTATAPVTGNEVPIVAGAFVDPAIATGVVMSVPAHAPFDWAYYVDAGLEERLGAPLKIIETEGYGDLPARQAALQHGATGPQDHEALQAATEQVYADEFNKGVLNDRCGPYAGQRVRAAKDTLRGAFLDEAHARLVRQFSEPVISRAGETVDIRRIPDQDFIQYSDPEWTAAAKEHALGMQVLPQRYHEELPHVLDWFGDRACVRRGAWLGTPFPFKEGWVVEPIADSTFYPWYYLVSLYVNEGRLDPEDLTDAFFDHVINGRGDASAGGERAELWRQVRQDVLHWGPVDLNLGGKEHQTVHFPVYIMNQVALLDDPAMRPQGIFVNWWVTQQAGAKISKSKGGAEPIPGAAKKYGVDPMRLYYCHVGSPHVDIEWDPEIVLTYRQHVLRLGRLADDLLAVDGDAGPMDAWLESAFSRHLARAQEAYEQHDLRTAAGELVYGVPETLRWYQRRGGAQADLLRRVVRDWAVALGPIVPHVGEEMHERAGGEGLCTLAAWPSWPEADPAPLAAQAYVRAVLDDVQTVRKLAGVEAPEVLWLFTSPTWKRDLTARALRLAQETEGRFPMGDFMQQVMDDPEMRQRGKEVQQFAGRLAGQISRFTPQERALLADGLDEARLLEEAAPFLAEEADVPEVRVHPADDPDAPAHPKRRVAAPLKPGIAIE